MSKRKILLMGKAGSGKSSMRSIIFANYTARDTKRLGATIDVEHSHIRFLGNLALNLWDCGGQEAFVENYLTNQRDHIFRNVQVLVYIFDVESREMESDLTYYRNCLEALHQNSAEALVFCLIHKMDLVPEAKREHVFAARQEELLSRSAPLNVTVLKSSIWDESLYHAWSSIVCALIPNVARVETQLRSFCFSCDADEVVLFEKSTLLVIAHFSKRAFCDSHRFEKLSNIVKQFKLTCRKTRSNFESLEVKNADFTALMDAFTPSTCILVIMSDWATPSASTLLNINSARKLFTETLEVA